jgi:electron transport complex protein RnfG
MICVLAAGLCFSVCWAEDLPLKDVLPGAVSFTAVKKGQAVIYYAAKDKDGKTMGAVFKATGKSYSDIETLVGMLKDGTITAIRVLSQNETPGIGSRVSEPEFTERFRNVKDVSSVQAITGASVSSRAVIEAVKKKAEEIKQLIRGDQ